MAQKWHAATSNGHNLAILCPILKNLGTKMIYSSRRIHRRKDQNPISFRLVFSIFDPKNGRGYRKMGVNEVKF